MRFATGVNVVKMKPSYTNKQKDGTIKYIMQSDKAEKYQATRVA